MPRLLSALEEHENLKARGYTRVSDCSHRFWGLRPASSHLARAAVMKRSQLPMFLFVPLWPPPLGRFYLLRALGPAEVHNPQREQYRRIAEKRNAR